MFHQIFTKKAQTFYRFILLSVVALAGISSLQASAVYDTPPIELKDGNIWFQAIYSKDERQIKGLISSRNNVDTADKWGNTPFMAAAYKGGRIGIMRLLIDAGAQVDTKNNNGDTALMLAVYGDKEKEKKEVVQFLLTVKADLETMNNQELTPLMIAALNGHTESLKLLIVNGAKLEATGKQGRTALALAVDNERNDSVKALIAAKADIEARDQFSFTPLMIAAMKNEPHIVKLLIKAGANINARTTMEIPVSKKKDVLDFMPKKEFIPKGATPLLIAKRYGGKAVEKAIADAGGK